MSAPLLLGALALAYLLGAVPSAYLAGRLRGLDIRRHGSGNVGATNALRVLGKGPGAAVLAADVAKGFLAVALLPHLAAPAADPARLWWPCALGLVAVLGHSYTVFLDFKGGKGVATSLGVFLALAPWATLAAVAVFAAVVWRWRMVSAGSLAGAVALPAVLAAAGEWRPVFLPEADPPAGWLGRPVGALALGLAGLVWIRHLPNLRRIAAGTEHRFGTPKGGGA